MISLFIDTSLDNVSISIVRDGKITALKQENIPNKHSVYATSFIKEVIDSSEITPDMVDKIMVVTGPGSFTGVRIGVTIAKTYGYLIKRGIIPISSLKALAISSKINGMVMSVIPANKSSYYVGIYDNEYNEVIDERNAKKEEILRLIDEYQPYIVGVKEMGISENEVVVSKLDVLKIVNYYMDKEEVNYFKLVPNYLKLPQALEDRK